MTRRIVQPSTFYVWKHAAAAPRAHSVLRLLTRQQWLLLTDEQRQQRADVLRAEVERLRVWHERRFHTVTQYKKCSVDGCNRHSRTRGMCPTHYARSRAYGAVA